MTRRLLLAVPAALVAGIVLTAASAPKAAPAAAERARRGVALAGAEFGTDRPAFSNRNRGVHGQDFRYNGQRTYDHLAAQGVNLFRLPVRWERLQPTLGGPLDAGELNRLRAAVEKAAKVGGEAVIDLHNFGRYVVEINGLPCECAINERVNGTTPVTADHFADLWRRLAREFKGSGGVYAYGLMNEPHDQSDWKAVSQVAVTAIRAEGDRTRVLVPGTDWSHAHRFAEANGSKAWITDPADNVLYEAHCYLDRDASGKYAMGYDAELAADPKLADRAKERLQPFVDWCRANNVRGFVGEFGVPTTDARWLPLVEQVVAVMDGADLGGCYWAAGEWWGDYKLSVQPATPNTLAGPLAVWRK
jgi:endoglucanase